jgi:hypothetical protein
MNNLKPCPFCGKKAVVQKISTGNNGSGVFTASFRIGCDSCKIGFVRESKFVLDKSEVIFIHNGYEEVKELWNSRFIDGETSDGYHTFNELYHHRAVLFSVIVSQYPELCWKSKRHHDGTMYDGMFIVGIETPTGQATYHYDIDPYFDMFECKEVEYAPEWDGHTPDDGIRRIATLKHYV